MMKVKKAVNVESIGGKLFHYQDYSNCEIDAVIELEDGVWVVPVTALKD